MNSEAFTHIRDLLRDYDGPNAVELSNLVKRAVSLVETDGLRVGIVGAPGRNVANVLELVDGVGVTRDVWSFGDRERPAGVDVWFLLVGEEPLAPAEREFVQRLRDSGADAMHAVLQSGVVPAGLNEDASEIESIDVSTDPGALATKIQGLAADLEALRAAALRTISAAVRPELSAIAESLEARIRRLPNAESAERAQEDFQKVVSTYRQDLPEAREKVVSEVCADVNEQWVNFLSGASQAGGKFDQERFLSRLDTWLNSRVGERLGPKMREAFADSSKDCTQLDAALRRVAARAAVLERPSLEFPESTKDELPNGLRWVLPIAGGGVGYWRGGWAMGLVGAGLGMLVARFMRPGEGQDPLAGQKGDVVRHVRLHVERTFDELDEYVTADFDIQSSRLSKEIEAALSKRTERANLVEAKSGFEAAAHRFED